MKRFLRDWCVGVALAALVAVSPNWSQDAGEALPVVASVKPLSSSRQSAAMRVTTSMAPADDAPKPTLPGGKLPQYQMTRASRDFATPVPLNDPRVRLVLALPSRPLLIEAEITIDGQPFRMAREARIAGILDALRQPMPDESPNSEPQDSKTSETEAVELDIRSLADEANEDGEPKATVAPATVPAYSLATTATEQIRRYAVAIGTEPSADEVRWVLANWSDGPVLLPLRDNFQRFRARERPVFDVLDTDRDDVVSERELERAVDALRECDLNRDDVVDATEIAAAAHDARRAAVVESDPGVQLIELSDEVVASTIRRLSTQYDVTPEELDRFQGGPPDVTVVVSFNTSDPAQSTLAVTQVSRDANDVVPSVRLVESAIALSLAGETILFSAVQGGRSDQVSLGAVADGYPLLPEIDPNDDGRFTIRELRGLVDGLKRLDANRDGALTADEVRAPVRVCFGLGPIVHRELASIRSRNRAAGTPVVEGPAWFVRMDRNRDRDLSRSEFPGTDEQFTALDADGDELVSAAEALTFDQASRTTDDVSDPDHQTPQATEPEME